MQSHFQICFFSWSQWGRRLASRFFTCRSQIQPCLHVFSKSCNLCYYFLQRHPQLSVFICHPHSCRFSATSFPLLDILTGCRERHSSWAWQLQIYHMLQDCSLHLQTLWFLCPEISPPPSLCTDHVHSTPVSSPVRADVTPVWLTFMGSVFAALSFSFPLHSLRGICTI